MLQEPEIIELKDKNHTKLYIESIHDACRSNNHVLILRYAVDADKYYYYDDEQDCLADFNKIVEFFEVKKEQIKKLEQERYDKQQLFRQKSLKILREQDGYFSNSQMQLQDRNNCWIKTNFNWVNEFHLRDKGFGLNIEISPFKWESFYYTDELKLEEDKKRLRDCFVERERKKLEKRIQEMREDFDKKYLNLEYEVAGIKWSKDERIKFLEKEVERLYD